MRGNVAKGSDKTRGDTLIPDTSFATPTHAQSITTPRSCGCVSDTVVSGTTTTTASAQPAPSLYPSQNRVRAVRFRDGFRDDVVMADAYSVSKSEVVCTVDRSPLHLSLIHISEP